MDKEIKRLLLFINFNALTKKNIMVLVNEETLYAIYNYLKTLKKKGLSFAYTDETKTAISVFDGTKIFYITSYSKEMIKNKFYHSNFNIVIALNDRNKILEIFKKDTLKIEWPYSII